MAEKPKYVDRIMLRRGLSKFDASLLSNDGGKYSPSIRRLRQHYLNDTKYFTGKIFLSPMQLSSTAKPFSNRTSESQLSSSPHRQSSIDFTTTPLKCDDCQKNEGLFQCCHCNQRLCIRCCNKHYKKVTAEFEHLHELSNCLLTKIIHKKTNLEKQKNETIEQCHKWRIDTINKINKAHKLLIQTIYDEYEILHKEYELFIEKDISFINMDKNELMRMKKANIGSLLLSAPSSSTITTTKSIDLIKNRIEMLSKHINEIGNFSFQVNLPTFDINDNLKIESHYGDKIRSTTVTCQNEDYINDTSFIESEEMSEKKPCPDSQPINSSSLTHDTNDVSCSSPNEKNISDPSNHYDNISRISSSSLDRSFHNSYQVCCPVSPNQLNTLNNNHNNQHIKRFQRTLSSSVPPIDNISNDNDDTCQSVRIKREHNDSLEDIAASLKQSQTNDEIIKQQRTCMSTSCDVERRMTSLPVQLPSISNIDRLSNDYPLICDRAGSVPPLIQ